MSVHTGAIPTHSRVRAGKRMQSPPLQQPGPSLAGAPIASVCCVSAMRAPRASVSLKQRAEYIGAEMASLGRCDSLAIIPFVSSLLLLKLEPYLVH